MKNLVFNLAIALVVIAYVVNISYDAKKEAKVSKETSIVLQTNNQKRVSIVMNSNKSEQKNNISTGFRVSTIGKTTENVKSDFATASIRIEKMESDAVQTQILFSELIENMFPINTGKTNEEVIAEDNAIIGNNFTNETQSLDLIAIENKLPNRIEKSIEEVIAQDNMIIGNEFSNETQALDLIFIENNLPNRIGKTIEEVIAEDNATIGNDFSNETQALDFNVTNSKSQFEATIDNITYNNSGKTIEEIIAEDNEITGNNFSNETRALAILN